MLCLQSFLRKGVSLGYVGLNENPKDLKDNRRVLLRNGEVSGYGGLELRSQMSLVLSVASDNAPPQTHLKKSQYLYAVELDVITRRASSHIFPSTRQGTPTDNQL